MNKPSGEASFGSMDLVMLFIIAAFFLAVFEKTTPMQTSVTSTQAVINQGLTSNRLAPYDNQVVKGADVISCIKTNATQDMTIVVQTIKDSSGVSYNSPSYNITDISDPDYIEYSAPFRSTISKTSNGTQNKITFVQQ